VNASHCQWMGKSPINSQKVPFLRGAGSPSSWFELSPGQSTISSFPFSFFPAFQLYLVPQ